ncbi:MAG: LysR substrate-binding domain-containing protein [Pseudomonadota bacterium]
MSALVSFEAAARHSSFKTAANELNVTPAAVSHQVKALETELHCQLFRRYPRGVELTETGAYLLVSVQRGFHSMAEAVDHLRARKDDSSVTIRSTTAVSSLWLTPRLAQFWKEHGNISVSQVITDDYSSAPECDLSIQYGDISKESGKCRRLFHDRIVPLGSPRLAAGHNIETIADLATLPLIHLEAPETGWTDWKGWCRQLGYSGPLEAALRVNNYIIAIQAAEDDMGAVLGWESLTASIVESGRLVRLLPDAVNSPMDFFVKLHPHASHEAEIIYNWLASEASASNENRN